MKIFLLKSFLLLTFLFFISFSFSQIPSGYYNAADGKTGETLRAALRDITTNSHVKLPYTSTAFDVWDAYAVTDVRPAPNNTTIWDMYSDKPSSLPDYTFTIYTDQCGTASQEGDCYSREHCMPNSWWGGIDNAANPQYTDLHHLFACDQYVNMYKSNYPIGQTTAYTYISSNGSKRGPSSYTGYSGVVFEPIDEYKGDFARAWLYLATRYMSVIGSWVTDFPGYDSQYVIDPLTNNYKTWFINMLLNWHALDAVSQKEIDRNNAIYYNTPQHNRNPYIDNPDYVNLVFSVSTPTISNIAITPSSPSISDGVVVSSDITDNGSISRALLYWDVTKGVFNNSIEMSVGTAPVYVSDLAIPGQPVNTIVYYKIVATDNESNVVSSDIYSYKITASQTVFFDNFSSNNSASYTTSGSIEGSVWNVTRSGDDWGARRNNSPQQLELTNDAGGTANANGWAFASTQTSSFNAPYNTTLSSNTGLVTWSFNMRQIRPDPAGFNSGNYGLAFILVGSSTTANNTGNGYAVLIGNTTSTDPVRLVKYSSGLTSIGTDAPPTLKDIIVANTTGLTDFGVNYLSVKVTYNPSSNQWRLFLRDDGSSAFSDASVGNMVPQGSATDNTYTGSALDYMGAYWQGSTGANQTAFFDNVKVAVDTNAPNTWTGNSSTGWNNAGNWFDGQVPGSEDNIVIPNDAGYNIELTGSVIINDLEIEQNASLTISSNGMLTVDGTLTNNGTLIIKSDATGTGSLIHETPNVDATVEKYLAVNNLGWTVASPVLQADKNIFENAFNVYLYNPLLAEWDPYTVDDGDMDIMRGYWTKFNDADKLIFSDVLNTNIITYTNFYRTGVDNGNCGWNFLGNPYPSSINWDDVVAIDENGGSYTDFLSATRLNSAVHISDNNGGYHSYNNDEGINGFTGIIPPATAFWIQVNDAFTDASNPIENAQLTFDNTARVHSISGSKKKSNNNVIRLVLQNKIDKDETIIGLKSGASSQFDPQFDAAKMLSANLSSPQIYSVSVNNEKYAINCLPDKITQSTAVPIGFVKGSSNDLTITINDLTAFNTGISVYLEDKKTHSFIDLKFNNSYNFNSTLNQDNDRLVLHLLPLSDSNISSLTTIYAYDNAIYINLTEETSFLSVYNMLGQVIIKKDLFNKGLHKINVNNSSGNLIVTLLNSNNLLTQKVFINANK